MSNAVRPLAGLATIAVIVAVVAFSVMMFRGGFGQTVPVTVVSERAGLVMNPEAKVKMRGVQVGQVESIETRPDGKAVLHLAMNPDELKDIPANVLVEHRVDDRVRCQVRRTGRPRQIRSRRRWRREW